jgi:hypothetical protein
MVRASLLWKSGTIAQHLENGNIFPAKVSGAVPKRTNTALSKVGFAQIADIPSFTQPPPTSLNGVCRQRDNQLRASILERPARHDFSHCV